MKITFILLLCFCAVCASALAPNPHSISSLTSPSLWTNRIHTSPLNHHRGSHSRPTNSRLQAIPPHVWTSLGPPFLGLYKSEWTVSLGYGTAVAGTAAALARQFPASSLAALHAAPLVFYGIRLNIFLILRNVYSRRIQETNQRIEDRALAKGNRFTTRLPFILSCGLLYYGLAIPVWLTGTLTTPPLIGWKQALMKALVACQWLGFGVAALGDLTKTYVKASEGDENFLVTSGIFSWLRHPNYTGEIVGWTGNALLGLVAVGWNWSQAASPYILANLGLLALGWVGISFVLLRATSNLESRQAKEYGQLEKYQSWIATSWSGWLLPSMDANDDKVTPHLEPHDDSIEYSGSGI